MAIVADQVRNRIAETGDDPVKEVLADLASKRKSRAHAPAIRTLLSNWKAWAIGGVAAVALTAFCSIAIFNNVARPGEHRARGMGYVKPQDEVVPQRLVPAANLALDKARLETAEKSTSEMKNGLLAGTRTTPAANPQDPMIARTASLIILVRDFVASRASLDTILARYGGYSASLTIDTPEGGQRRFQASLRMPANQLDSALADLKKLGRTLNESQSGEEVTQQHADLVARLQNSRETEQRLRAILEQRTGKIDDVLQVEQEIARVRSEIESMESEQKALEHRVTFAGVELQLVEQYKEQFNASPMATSGRLRNAFVEGMRNAFETVLGLILLVEAFGPSIFIWTAILGVPAFLGWRRHRRLHARNSES